MQCVIGIDIGTTSTIGILIALPDKVLASASRAVSLSSPHPGWAEEDPNQWWANTCQLIPELLRQAQVDSSAVQAVGVTGMLPAVVLLDAEGQLLRPAIQQSDARCGQEVADIAAEIDEDTFVSRAGNGINQQLVGAKLRWLEKHEPDVFSRIATVFGSYDYINWRLTGKRALEKNWALEAGFVDIGSLELSDELLRLAHIPAKAVPPLIATDQVLGGVSEEAAGLTGLIAGTPVIGGAADHIASAYVAGVTDPGDVLLKFGGATDILIVSQQAAPDPRMFLDLHQIPGLYMPNGCMASGGSALNWFVEKFAQQHQPAAEQAGLTLHQYMDKLAERTPAGSEGVLVLPYFLGEKTPIHDPDARGLIHGLSLSHGPEHLWRALLEGFGYAFRHHVEVFNDMGHTTTRFLASDGGAGSSLWMQICADILQEPIQLLLGHPGSCLGAAWTAAVGAGLTDDWRGVTAFVSYGYRVLPNQQHQLLYDAGYQRFRDSYDALASPS